MTVYIEWQDNYNLGHEKIDRQHQFIITIINKVYSLVKNLESKDDIWVALNDLKQYTRDHFNFEEEIMSLMEYPEIESHKLLHQKMRTRTEEYSIKHFHVSSGDVAMETLALLKDWWLNHIRGIDTQYKPYLEKLKK